MTDLRKECIRHIEHLVSILPTVKTVLEVGIAGDVKPGGNYYLFKGCDYKTLDVDPQYKPDFVDDILDPVHAPKNHFDLVLLSNTIEHTPDPLQAIVGANSLVKPGGYLLVDCPWVYPYHAEDGFGDYWRISKDGMSVLLTKAGLQAILIMPGVYCTSALAQKS